MIALPFDAKEAFGRVRAPVRVAVNGYEFRTTTMRYAGVDYIGLNRTVRDAARIEANDTLTVTMELDTAPRTVEVPAELELAFTEAADARAAYDGLSFTHRKEYARWVGEAKRVETRRLRAERAVAMLRDGIRTPAAAASSAR